MLARSRVVAVLLAVLITHMAARAAHAEDAFLAATPEAQKSYESAKGLRDFGIVWGSLGGAGLLTSIAVGQTSWGCSETGDLGCLPRDIGLVIAGGASVVLFLIPGLISMGVGSSKMHRAEQQAHKALSLTPIMVGDGVQVGYGAGLVGRF